jgi:hypothetical protein
VYTVMAFGMLTYLASRHVERPVTCHLLRGGAVVVIVVTGPSRMIKVTIGPLTWSPGTASR